MQLHERTVGGLHGALFSRLPPLANDAAILDVGCGTGAWLSRLAAGGFTNLHGVDRDVTACPADLARFERGNLDVDDLGFGETTFSMISAIEIVEHLQNPGRLFQQVARRLAPGGVFVMTTPNIHSVNARLRFLMTGKMKYFDGKSDPTHLFPMLVTCLERLLPPHGLQLDKVWGFPEDGSTRTSRLSTRLAAALVSAAVPKGVPGDVFCCLVSRAPSAAA